MNTDLLLSVCRGHHLSIAGSWFQRKDIQRFSWISNDGHTRKEIDHILSSCGKIVRQCRVYRSFDDDSDDFPVLATLKPKLKRSSQPQSKHFIPNLSYFSNIDVSRDYAANVSLKLRAASLEDQPLEAMWGHYKSALDFAAREVLGKRLCAKNPWTSKLLLLLLISAGYQKERCRGIQTPGRAKKITEA